MFCRVIGNNIRRTISSGWAILGGFALWELYVYLTGINVIVLPPPSAVGKAIFADFEIYLGNALSTIAMALIGLAVGTAVGAMSAVFGSLSTIASGFVTVSAVLVRSIPFVVFVPIFALLVGYTNTMVVIIVSIVSFFPSFVMVSSALASLPRGLIDLHQVYGGSTVRRMLYIGLPAALPKVFSAIRMTAPRAVLAAMVAEFLTGIEGLGRLFIIARADLESETALGATFVAAAAALALYYLAAFIEVRMNARLT